MINQEQKHINWLILGGGAVVQEYYLPAFQYLGWLDQLTIVEPSDSAIKALAKWQGIKIIQLPFEDFLVDNNSLFHKAIITVPNNLHEAAIRLCLQKGIPVLCEKPLVLDIAACIRIQQYSSEARQPVFTGMVRRYMPSLIALKKSVEQGLVGDILSIEVQDGNPFAWVADSYAFFNPQNGGVLADMGVHYLDLLYHLFGELNPIKYKDDAKGGVEANCNYYLQTNKGIPVQLHLSRTYTLKNHFKIIGTKGTLWLETDQFDKCFYTPVDTNTIHEIKSVNAFTDVNLPYNFSACFVEQLIAFNQLDNTLVTIDQAKASTTLLEWAYNQHSEPQKCEAEGIYITGATGFIGAALVERICKNEQFTITAPVRGYHNCAAIGRYKIELPRVDILDYEAVKKSMKGARYVVHLAYDSEGKNAYQVNVEGTKNVVMAAYENGIEAIVVLSTIYVYGISSEDKLLNEFSPYKPAGGDYGRSKKLMQEWCLQWAAKNNSTKMVLLNPSCVYGPEGKTYTTLPYSLSKSNRFCWIEDGKGLANVVYIDNLLDAIEIALTSPHAHGQNFIINDGTLPWKEFLTPLLLNNSNQQSLTEEEIRSSSFKGKSTNRQIVGFLLNNYQFLELVNKHIFWGAVKKKAFNALPRFKNKLQNEREIIDTKSKQIVQKNQLNFNPPGWLADLFGPTFTRFSSEKAKTFLDWKPRITIDEGLKKTSDWLTNPSKL